MGSEAPVSVFADGETVLVEEADLDQFYHRLRTPSYADRAKDAKEMAKTKAAPLRFNDRKLFANSSWEFNKWHGYEIFGVLRILFFVILIYISLFAVVKIGS